MSAPCRSVEWLREPFTNKGCYREVKRIGEGSFGEVMLGVDTRKGTFVALKRIHMADPSKRGVPKAALREMRALQQLEHENVVALLDVYPVGADLVLVLDYMASDLEQVITKSTTLLPESHVKAYLWMLLQGVSFMHSRNILHRDLKPSNLLISHDGTLKIGDFGLARVWSQPQLESYSHQVATRWYRAPELLLAARWYGPAVDMWAVGAVFAELCTLNPAFPGNSDMDQLFRVLRVMGSPSEETWPSAKDLPDYEKVLFPDMPAQPLHEAFLRMNQSQVDYLSGFLCLEPSRRISAGEALQHPYLYLSPAPADPQELQRFLRPLPGVKAVAPSRSLADGPFL